MPRVNKNEADSIESHEQTLRHDEPSCLGRVSMKVFSVCVYLGVVQGSLLHRLLRL